MGNQKQKISTTVQKRHNIYNKEKRFL